MEYEWYADVFLLTNLLMDMSAMFAAALLLNDRLRLGRCLAVCAAGVTGSTVLLILLKKYLIYSIVLHTVIHPLMAFCVFGAKGKRRFLRTLLTIYLILFVMGGVQNSIGDVTWKQHIGYPAVRDGSGTFVLYLSDPMACHSADLPGGVMGRDRTCYGRCLLRYREFAARFTDRETGLHFAAGSIRTICH